MQQLQFVLLCRYCDLQLKNDKTAGILKSSFKYMGPAGQTFVDRYLTEVLFDHAFHYDVDDVTKTALRENRADLGNAKSSRGDQVANEVLDKMMKEVQESEKRDDIPEDS